MAGVLRGPGWRHCSRWKGFRVQGSNLQVRGRFCRVVPGADAGAGAGAAGTGLLGRRWAGPVGGAAAGAAYALSPYVLHNASTRFDLAEAGVLGVLPIALWGLARVADSGWRVAGGGRREGDHGDQDDQG